MLTFPSALRRVPPPPPQTIGLAPAKPESQPSSSDAKTQPTDFSQIPQILRASFRCMTSFAIPGHIFYLGFFYFDISEWHILPTCAWAPVLMLHLTNPCAKWKVLSLTKPNGKTYKTKSLGHYITFWWSTNTGVSKFTSLYFERNTLLTLEMKIEKIIQQQLQKRLSSN